MMGRRLAFSVAGFVLLLVFLLGYKIYRVRRIKETAAARTITLPVFSFIRLDGSTFSDDSLGGDRHRLIIMFFSPDCEHCQYTARAFLRRSRELDRYRILMITPADSGSAARFYADYGLSSLSNVTILRDQETNFPRVFGVGVIPSFFVYKNGYLVNKFIGETRIDNLLSDHPLITQR